MMTTDQLTALATAAIEESGLDDCRVMYVEFKSDAVWIEFSGTYEPFSGSLENESEDQMKQQIKEHLARQ